MNPHSQFVLLGAWITLFVGSATWSWAANLASPALSQSEALTFKTWSTEHGLPQTSVQATLQTRDGYLWVGTLNGLARFDGVRFRSYTAANTPELFSDSINVLYEDRAGDLWIGTVDGGLVRYHQGRFTLFSNADGLGSITINAVSEDGEGALWVGTAGGLHRMVSSNRFERVPPALVPVEVIAGLRTTRDGGVWVITLEAVRLLRQGRLAQPPIQLPKVIGCFELDRSGDLWLGLEEETMARVRAGTMTWTEEKIAAKATTLFRDRKGILWLGSSTGELWQADAQGAWTRVARPVNSRILAIQDDAHGNLWLGVEGVGLCRLREKLVTTHASGQDSLGSRFTSMAEDSHGRIWMGTMGEGLLRWEGDRFVPVPIASSALNVTSLLFDRHGTLICGTLHVHYGQVYRRATNDDFVAELEFGRQCRTLFEDGEGGLWVGKWRGGVEHYKNGMVTRYVPTNGLSNDRIYSIAQDEQGDIWIGTLHGLNRLSNGKFTRFYREDGLGGNDVRVLFVDRQGSLWAGSTGGGLTRYQNGRFTTITTREGLISDWVEQILEDDEGNLWLGSNAGIMRASLRELNDCASARIPYVHCVAFRREEGLLLPNCGTGFQPSALKTRAGQLWFATHAGIVVIDPKQIKPNRQPPPVHIETVSVDGQMQEVYPKSSSAVTVFPGKQRVEFHYTGLDLSAPGAVRFKHKLEGYDRHWVNAGARREAIYTRLPPGRFQFRVTAANNDGVWNETGAMLPVIVVPPWWQTGWFRAVSIIALAGLVFGVYELRVYQHKKARAMQQSFSRRLIESQEQERKRVAAELHDSLGQSLQIIKGRAELGLNPADEPDERTRQFEEISEAATQAIREVRSISHALRPAELDQLGLSKALDWMAQQAGATSRTRFACELENINGLLPPELEVSLYRIAQEGINNVLQHAQASEAILELTHADGIVRLSLFDNGRGFVESSPLAPARARFGQGLAGITERIKLMGGEFELQSAPGRGTRLTVTCRIPTTPHER